MPVGKGCVGGVNLLRIPVPPSYVDVINEGQLCEKFPDGRFEPETLEVWGRLMERGVEVFDVGAHTGIYSIAAAKLGARPVAIEPLPFLVDRLGENARLNGVEFNICEAAACDAKGEAEIGYMAHINMPYGASLLRKDKPDHTKLMVKTVRLDDFKMSRVKAIKIDVERAEINVLRGAQQVIDRWRPFIILEALNERAVRKTTAFLWRTYGSPRTLDHRNLLFEPR